LGEVGHKLSELWHCPVWGNRLLKPLVQIPRWERLLDVPNHCPKRQPAAIN